jgi:hypothetical protein
MQQFFLGKVSEYDSRSQPQIPVWSEDEIGSIRKACRLARQMINITSTLISPGKKSKLFLKVLSLYFSLLTLCFVIKLNY